MPANAYRLDDSFELQLDLLVDGELPETRRRDLLLAVDRDPSQWRHVALRFLERQTEKQSVRRLMAGGNVLPEHVAPPRAAQSVLARIGLQRMLATAAGLVIAAGSALVTLYATRAPQVAAELHTSIPADAVAYDRALPVSVPVVQADAAPVLPASARGGTRESLVIQQHGDGVIVIPVSAVKGKVY